MKRHFCRVLPSVVLFGLIVLGACDPQQQAMKIFTDQGLVLLQPARSYITPQGIVILPKKGRPKYYDPLDADLGTDNGTEISNFSAIVAQETKNQSSALDIALGLLGKLIKIPAGLKYNGSQTVTLDQIDAGGSRLATNKMLTLLKATNTHKFLVDALTPVSGQPTNRAFIVEEVYTTKSLSLKTTSNTALQASYGGSGGSLPSCTQGNQNQNQNQPNNKNGTGSPSGSKPSDSSKGPLVNNMFGNDSFVENDSQAQNSDNQTGNTNANNKGSDSNGITVGACRNTEFDLTLKSDNPIPFAVRLNEIQLNAAGEPELKLGQFKFPPNSLGTGDVEARTAFVDSSNSPLTGMRHEKPPTK